MHKINDQLEFTIKHFFSLSDIDYMTKQIYMSIKNDSFQSVMEKSKSLLKGYEGKTLIFNCDMKDVKDEGWYNRILIRTLL